MGGTFGDLTERIINNGVNLKIDLKLTLKSGNFTEKLKNEIYSLDLNCLVGHSTEPLIWNWDRIGYVINILNDELLTICAKRYFLLCPNIEEFKSPLEIGFSKKLLDKTRSINDRINLYKVLLKNFSNIEFKTSTKINLDCIYDKNLYINTLLQHFSFDIKKAHFIYDEWFTKEQYVLQKLGQSFN